MKKLFMMIAMVMSIMLTACGMSQKHMPAYIHQLKRYLGVPDSLNVTYEVSEPYYWAAGEKKLVWVTFYHNGKAVASAEIDEKSHEPERSILGYNGQ